ncbi:2-isopropylmalate synthase [Roseospira marina]|uniref:2-isopropylmalate synthase n=1 Tax=Roseospira marina TaxID=140057 RepID=A0A5M6IB03_9PROT|nr:2-isopropylmalate synthase [Roseospira marina]MBB4313499.1 2-isopropylmalate synthase [Roseospira marina]MBB5086661.1 2-isopropylmalate synthase [Roseospira marina]
MRVDPTVKYKPFQPIDLPDRRWPSASITEAPIWASVDLRDGNQALVEPMGIERKARMYKALVAMGFKEIEVGFPAASQTDFDFARYLIEHDMVPEDVTLQVLVQAREPLIRRTFEALKGCKRAIVHVYNSTSTLQRRVVFGMDRPGIIDIARQGAELIHTLADETDTEIVYQYSPESFTGTELDFAVEIVEAVMDVYQPTPEKRLIVNLPSTVEMATPNVYADQIEWFCRNVKNRDSLIISVHPHNDRGTGVAATELALMAGADRVEGTLFGNGERTGNVDVVTLAMNMFTQGIHPGLDCSNMPELVTMAEYCTRLPIHPRHPYAGELVFTAFSGSHQDAINKGLRALRQSNSGVWEVPYLPIDPTDVGRSYEAVIRINSQSGKGGVAHILERDHALQMPRPLQVEFSGVVQHITDESEGEVTAKQLWDIFQGEYLAQNPGDLALKEYRTVPDTHASDVRVLDATLVVNGEECRVSGRGNGPLDAFVDGLRNHLGMGLEVVNYSEHALGVGASAQAYAYVEMKAEGHAPMFGVGRHANIVQASLNAILSAVNRVRRLNAAGSTGGDRSTQKVKEDAQSAPTAAAE